VAVALLAGCGSTSRIEQEAPATLTEFAPQAQVRELWRADVGTLGGEHDARLTPVLEGNTLYVANADGRVHALAADSGRTRWETDLKVTLSGATAAGAGLVAVGTPKGEVIALEADSGKRRWASKVSSAVQAPPAIRGDFVIVQTVDGKVSALAAGDGKRLWSFERSEPALSLHGTSTPVVAAQFVLTGFANGKIVALGLNDGKQLWEHTVAQARGRNEIERLVDVDAPVLLWGDTLYAVAYQGKLIAVDMRSGRPAWTRDVSSYVGMDADRGAVFLADDKGNVLAFDSAGGSNLWRQDKLHGRRLSAPVLHDSALVVGDAEGYLHWLARDDGRFVARHRVSSAGVEARAVSDGATLYVASRDGRLAALKLEPSR
jgi:outer membrane protein assembly factor BamB